MKKKSIIATLLTITTICSLAGCGSKEAAKETAQTKEQETVGLIEDISDISTYVTLPDYAAYETTTEKQEVTDDDIRNYINENMLTNLSITNRAAEAGDTVCIDYELSSDIIGTENYTDQYFVLGDGTLQEDFENNLTGMSAGETKDFTFAYPENMSDEFAELSGTEAAVKVTMKSISTSLNFDLASDEQIAEYTKYASKDELRDEVKTMIDKAVEDEYRQNISDEIRQYILSYSHIQDIPELLIEDYADHYIKHMDNLVKVQAEINSTTETESSAEEGTEATTEGISGSGKENSEAINYKEHLMNDAGYTEYEYNEEVWETAKRAIREYLILEAVARQEEITATDEEISEYAEKVYADYGYDSADSFSATLGRNICRMYVISEKIAEKLAEN